MMIEYVIEDRKPLIGQTDLVHIGIDQAAPVVSLFF